MHKEQNIRVLTLETRNCRYSHYTKAITMKTFLFLLLMTPALLICGQTKNKSCTMHTGIIDPVTHRVYYTSADIMPAFIDASFSIDSFFLDNLQLPTKKCSQSEIVVSFAVDTNGTITHKRIIKKPDCVDEKEILKILDNLPPMKPGHIRIAKVPVVMEYSIIIPKNNKRKHH
jgi:hypothetical protein